MALASLYYSRQIESKEFMPGFSREPCAAGDELRPSGCQLMFTSVSIDSLPFALYALAQMKN